MPGLVQRSFNVVQEADRRKAASFASVVAGGRRPTEKQHLLIAGCRFQRFVFSSIFPKKEMRH